MHCNCQSTDQPCVLGVAVPIRRPDANYFLRTDHPAVAVAGAYFLPYRLRLRAVPEFVPFLPVEVAHDLLILRAVARHDIAVRVDEEGVEAHITGQQALLSVNIIDQTVVEIRAEPLFRAVGF